MSKFTGRREPYTDAGIRRVPCAAKGCTNKASASWQACANGRRHVPVCREHDIALNRAALELIGMPNADELMADYEGAEAAG